MFSFNNFFKNRFKKQNPSCFDVEKKLNDIDKDSLKRIAAEEVILDEKKKELERRKCQLDQEIIRIQQSTKVTFKIFSKWHNALRGKFRWYYKWHVNPVSNVVHYSALTTYAIVLTIFALQNQVVNKNPEITFASQQTQSWNTVGEMGDLALSNAILSGSTVTLDSSPVALNVDQDYIGSRKVVPWVGQMEIPFNSKGIRYLNYALNNYSGHYNIGLKGSNETDQLVSFNANATYPQLKVNIAGTGWVTINNGGFSIGGGVHEITSTGIDSVVTGMVPLGYASGLEAAVRDIVYFQNTNPGEIIEATLVLDVSSTNYGPSETVHAVVFNTDLASVYPASSTMYSRLGTTNKGNYVASDEYTISATGEQVLPLNGAALSNVVGGNLWVSFKGSNEADSSTAMENVRLLVNGTTEISASNICSGYPGYGTNKALTDESYNTTCVLAGPVGAYMNTAIYRTSYMFASVPSNPTSLSIKFSASSLYSGTMHAVTLSYPIPSEATTATVFSDLGTTEAFTSNDNTYYASGTATKSQIDSGIAGSTWSTLSWVTTALPAGTSVKGRLRAAETTDGLAGATWSDFVTTSGNSLLVAGSATPTGRYADIEFTLATTDTSQTPVVDSFTVNYYSSDCGGSGTSGDPYMICNVYQLQAINNNLTAHYKLANDIDAAGTSTWNSGAGFVPIGSTSPGFSGVLDGDNHIISGLTINRSGTDTVGLFSGWYNETVIVKNLKFSSIDIIGSIYTGGVVGYVSRGDKIDNVHVLSGVISGTSHVGGLVGESCNIIINSSSNATVLGSSDSIGGLVGHQYSYNISKSFTKGSVYGSTKVGGLVGQANYDIQDSYSQANVVVSTGMAGGFVGELAYSGQLIQRNYSTGAVSGAGSSKGGFAGAYSVPQPAFSNNYWLQTTGINEGLNDSGSGDFADQITNKSPVDLKVHATYSGWTFPGIWTLDEDAGNQYPKLAWESGSDIGGGISVSGIFYGTDETTPLVMMALGLRVNGGTESTVSTHTSTGAFTFENIIAAAGDTITIYSKDVNFKGNLVTITDGSTAIIGADFYQNHVTVRSDNGANPITIADMADWDADDDSANMFFTANIGTPSTLSVLPGHEFFITSGKTFTPSGNITTNGGADINGTWNQVNGGVVNRGIWDATGGAFSAGTSTVTFSSDSSYSVTTNSGTFNNLILDDITGSGTTITLADNFTVSGNLTVQNTSLSNYNYTISAASAITITVNGNLSFPLTAETGSISFGENINVNLYGNLSILDSPYFVPQSINFIDTTKDQTFTQAAGWLGGTITINKGSYSLIAQSDIGSVSGGSPTVGIVTGTLNLQNYSLAVGPMTLTDGAITQGSGTISFLCGFSQSGGSFNGGSGPINTSTGCSYSINHTGGAFTSTSGTMTIKNDFTSSGGTFDHNSGTVQLVANSSYILTTGNITFNNVIFDNETGDGTTITLADNFTINGNMTIKSFAGERYYVTPAGTRTITIGGNVDIPDSSLRNVFFGDGNLTVNIAGNFTLNSSNVRYQANTVFNGTADQTITQSNGTIENSSWQGNKTSGNLILGSNVDLTSGFSPSYWGMSNANTCNFSAANYTLTVNSFSQSAGTFTAPTTFVVKGIPSGIYISGGTFNAASGTIKNVGSFYLDSDVTFNHGGGTIVLNPLPGTETSSITSSGKVFNNLTFDNEFGASSKTTEITDNTTVSGNLTVQNTSSSDYEYMINGGGRTLTVGGNLSFPNTEQTGQPLFFNASVYLSGNLLIKDTNAYLGGNTNIRFVNTSADQAIDYTAGTIANGNYWYIDNTSKTVALDNYLTANSSLLEVNVNSGTFYTNGFNIPTQNLRVVNGGTLRLKGKENLAASPTFSSGSTVEYVGYDVAENITLKDWGQTPDYYNLRINDTNTNKATFVLGAELDVDGNLELFSGTLDASASNYLMWLGGDLNTTSGILNARANTITFNRTDGSPQIISGDNTFNNFAASYGYSILKFEANRTQTISGQFYVAGTSVNSVVMTRRDGDPGQWNINPTGTESVSYVNVANSNNTGSTFCATYSTDGGNNNNWSISASDTCGAAPTATSGVSISSPSTTGFAVGWTDNSSDETGFKVFVSTTANADCSLATYAGTPDFTTASNAVSQSVSSKSINTQYCAKLIATNSYGDSAPAYSSSVYTLANTPAVPTLSAYSSNQMRITVAANSNPSNTTYAIAISGDAGSSWNYVKHADGRTQVSEDWQTFADWGGASGFLSSNLNVNKPYVYKVKARNGDSTETVFSSTATKYTLANTPSLASITGDYSLEDGYHADIVINASLNPVGTRFQIAYSLNNLDYNYTTGWVTDLSFIFKKDANNLDLVPNTKYYLMVWAENDEDVWTNFITGYEAFTSPGPPSSLVNSSTCSDSALMTWTGASGANTYTFSYGTDTAGTNLGETSGIAATQKSLTGLTSGTIYYWKVKSTSTSNGTGGYSEPVSFAATNCLISDAPASVSITSPTTTAFTVGWTDSSSDETGFKVYVSTTSNADCSTAIYPETPNYTTAANVITRSITGRSVNSAYCAKVTATNPHGDSLATYSGQKYTLANAPATPTLAVVSSSKLKITVAQNSNPANTLYAIYNQTTGKYVKQGDHTQQNSEDWQTYDGWGGATGFEQWGLTTNTAYTYKVKAKNGDNVITTFSGTRAATTKRIWTITVSAPTNGTISPGTVTVDSGDSKQFDITPSAGYYIGNIKATGVNVPGAYSSSYTFTNVTGNRTLVVTFVQNNIRIWDGHAADSNWSNLDNWTGNTVPGPTDNVVFNNTSTKISAIDAGFAGTIASLSVNTGYTGTITQSRELTTGNFTVSTGTLNTQSNTLNIGGSFLKGATAGIINLGTSTINFTSSTLDRTITLNGLSLNSITFDNAAGSWIFQDTATINGNITVANSDTVGNGVNFNNQSIDVNGNVTISGGKITAGSAAVSISGDWTPSGGTFVSNTSNFIFDKASGIQTITGDNTFSNLTFTASETRTVKFVGGSETVVSGTFTAHGVSGQLLTLTSTDSTAWKINPNQWSVSYVNVSYSINQAASAIEPANSIDGGNTLNWFEQAVMVSLGNKKTWTGDADFSGFSLLGAQNDSGNLKLTSATTNTFLGKWGSTGTGSSQFKIPWGMITDRSGNVYVVDTQNNRIQKFSSTGIFIKSWGSSGSGNGQFSAPRDIAIDTSGNLYVADYNNHRIQKFDQNGNFIAKYGVRGSGNGQLYYPTGIAVDSSGNMYISEWQNYRIQKLSSSGAYITKWGSSGSGDGQFNRPFNLEIDSSNNVYVADYYNHRIQKFTSSGTFLSKFGSYGTGNGQFRYPINIAIDSSDNIYVADFSNARVQKFNSSFSFISKLGSSGTTDGKFKNPNGIAIGPNGNIYVSDYTSNRIQYFSQSISGTAIKYGYNTGMADSSWYQLGWTTTSLPAGSAIKGRLRASNTFPVPADVAWSDFVTDSDGYIYLAGTTTHPTGQYADLEFTLSSGNNGYTTTPIANSFSVNAFASAIPENGGSVPITATLSRSTNEDITVNLAFSGDATRDTDYTIASSIVVPAGSRSASVDLDTINDANPENNESLNILLDTILGQALELNTQQISTVLVDNDYTIDSSASAGGTITPLGSTGVNGAADQSFGIVPSEGYDINDVLVDGASVGAVSSYKFESVTAAHTIEAQFSIKTFTITPSTTSEGTITPSTSQTVNFGSNKSFEIAPLTGYEIADVKIDGVSVGAVSSHTFENVTSDHLIEVSYNIIVLPIDVTSTGQGSVAPSGNISVNYNQSQTMVIAPEIGYYLSRLLIDNASYGSLPLPSSYTFSNVTTARTLDATFSLIPDGSFIINAEASKTNDRNVTVTPTVNSSVSRIILSESSDFVGAEYQDIANNISFTLSGNDGQKTIYAKFQDQSGYETASISKSIILDTVAPDSPTALAAVSGNTSVSLSWINPANSDFAKVAIFRSESPDFIPDLASNKIWNSASADTETYTDSTVENNKTYYYKTQALDDADNYSVSSSEVEGKPDSDLPTTPGKPALTNKSNEILELQYTKSKDLAISWSKASDVNSGLKSYTVIIGSESGEGDILNRELILTELVDTESPSLGFTVPSDGSYFIRVKAKDNLGNESAYSFEQKIIVDTVSPTVPANASAHDVSNRSSELYNVLLSCQGSVDTNAGILGYQIKRDGIVLAADENNFTLGIIQEMDNTLRYLDEVTPQTELKYQIIAFDKAKNESMPVDFQFSKTKDTDIFIPIEIPGEGVLEISEVKAQPSKNSGQKTSAVVTWKSSVPSTSKVEYGQNSEYTNTTKKDAGLNTLHTIILSDLSFSTTYHFRVVSADRYGHEVVSLDNTFTTYDILKDKAVLDVVIGNLSGSFMKVGDLIGYLSVETNTGITSANTAISNVIGVSEQSVPVVTTTVTIATAMTAIAMTPIANASTLFSFPEYIRSILYSLASLTTRKRRRQWGKVIEEGTGLPIAQARITLVQKADFSVRPIATTYTDVKGDFAFIADPGEYLLSIDKDSYELSNSPGYYHENEIITVKTSADSLVIPSIAMVLDEDKIQNKFRFIKALEKFDRIFLLVSTVVLIFGTLSVISVLMKNPRDVSYIILAFVYPILWYLNIHSIFKPSPYGNIEDRANHEGVPLALIRVFDKESQRLVKTSVSDLRGRYRMLLNKGQYRINVVKTGYNQIGDVTLDTAEGIKAVNKKITIEKKSLI